MRPEPDRWMHLLPECRASVLRRGVQFHTYGTGIETAQIYLGLKHQFPVLLSHRQRAEMNIVPVPGNLLLPS